MPDEVVNSFFRSGYRLLAAASVFFSQRLRSDSRDMVYLDKQNDGSIPRFIFFLIEVNFDLLWIFSGRGFNILTINCPNFTVGERTLCYDCQDHTCKVGKHANSNR